MTRSFALIQSFAPRNVSRGSVRVGVHADSDLEQPRAVRNLSKVLDSSFDLGASRFGCGKTYSHT
jgi:hypothetical protein